MTQEAQAIDVKHSRFWIEHGQRTGTCYKRPRAKLADLFPTGRGQHRMIRCGPKSPPRGCADLKDCVFALFDESGGAYGHQLTGSVKRKEARQSRSIGKLGD